MSIIYVLISKESEIVLCEYTENKGNFQTITRTLLRSLKPNIRETIIYDLYKIHYINQDNLTYLCMTSNFPEDVAFAFLLEVKKNFLEKYNYKTIMESKSYAFEDFNPKLKQLMEFYNKCPQKTQNGELIKNLVDAKNIAMENVEQLIERDGKINITVLKSDRLNDQSKNINSLASTIKNQKKATKLRNMRLLIGGGILIFIILLIIIF